MNAELGCGDFAPDRIVRTCSKLESGLNLSVFGVRACTRGAHSPPWYFEAEELRRMELTKEMLVEKRRWHLRLLNDDTSDIACKKCMLTQLKPYREVDFSRLGHIDLAHSAICNLRCKYCGYTQSNGFMGPQYDALAILDLFAPKDIEWNAYVDVSGGEPSLLEDLPQLLALFRAKGIRVMMHTNAVRFHQAIYDGLADGTIFWSVTSVDAGTASTYRRLRGRDCYAEVLENLSRYAVAGSKGKGFVAAKYIFSEGNCGEDDLVGFAYAMLALRPQKVWLTIDFSAMAQGREDYDYSEQIAAQARLYLLLRKHGIEAYHYYKETLAVISAKGREIMQGVQGEIARQGATVPLNDPQLHFVDFRNPTPISGGSVDRFTIKPLTLKPEGEVDRRWSLKGKRVLLAPASVQACRLLDDPEVGEAKWIGFVDRSPVLQQKTLSGRAVHGYESIASLNVDVVLLASSEKHREDILDALRRNAGGAVQIAEYEETATR